MKINEIIRKNRREQKLTQEQVAEYLGVSTPAVNKWEKGISYPDITILPSLARLLKVDLNTLLCFNEDLSEIEVSHFTNELVAIIEAKGFEEGYKEAIIKIQEYPTCDMLIYRVALTLEGALFMFGANEDIVYKFEIEKLYERVAKSDNYEIRNQANSMLIARYMEKEEYEKAQSLIDTLPKSPVDKVQRQAQLYFKQGKLLDASELIEGRLMSMASEIQSILVFMMEIALQENKEDVAKHLADTSANTAKIYDLWEYNKYMAHLQLAIFKKDTDRCIELFQIMLSTIESKWDMNNSPLYKHIKPKKVEESCNKQLIKGLIVGIRSDESCSFLRTNDKFMKLLEIYDR